MKEMLNELFEVIPIEIVCTAITLLGAIYANFTSRRISKATMEKEIEKLERTWKHDETTTFDQAYREMVDAVTKYLADNNLTNQMNARTKVALFLSYSDEALSESVADLYVSIKRRPPTDAEEKLMAVIACRRDMQKKMKEVRRFWHLFTSSGE